MFRFLFGEVEMTTVYYFIGLVTLILTLTFMIIQNFTYFQFMVITFGMIGYGALFTIDMGLSK